MKHTILITVNGFSFEAIADVTHTDHGRVVNQVTANSPPLQVLSDLQDSLADINDVLYVISHHLQDTARLQHAIELGKTDIAFEPLNPQELRADLAGKTYMVKITDKTGTVHLFDVGATDNGTAYYSALERVPAPVVSSLVQPLGV